MNNIIKLTLIIGIILISYYFYSVNTKMILKRMKMIIMK